MKPLQRKTFYVEMHRYFLVHEYLRDTAHRKRRHFFFCICREWFCNVVFGKDIATGPRPQNWFWLLWGSRMYFHVTYPTFQRFVWSGKKLFICPFIRDGRCTWLSVDFPFPIGQVRSQVWCRPYLAAYFGFFDLRTFPWSLRKVQESTFYPFTPKVGSKCT